MKKLILGRGEDCDLYLDDPKGLISRKHAILKIGVLGQYEITDVSKNGTFINGIRIKPHKPYKIKRKDIVVFANTSKLDWSEVPDYSKWIKIGIIGFVAALAIILSLIFIFRDSKENSASESIYEAMPAIERSHSQQEEIMDEPANLNDAKQNPAYDNVNRRNPAEASSKPKRKTSEKKNKTTDENTSQPKDSEEVSENTNTTEQTTSQEKNNPGGD